MDWHMIVDGSTLLSYFYGGADPLLGLPGSKCWYTYAEFEGNLEMTLMDKLRCDPGRTASLALYTLDHITDGDSSDGDDWNT